MNFGKHVKRKALYCCSVSVVGLLIACLIGFAMGVGLVDVHLEEEAHAAASSETSSTSGALKKNSAPQSQTQAVSSPTQVALDGISAVEGSATITTQGFTLSADSQAAVQSQIATFEADGYTASFVLADIGRPHDRIQRRCTDLFGLVGEGAIPDIAVLNGHRRPEQRGPIR